VHGKCAVDLPGYLNEHALMLVATFIADLNVLIAKRYFDS
jgi:thioredoxin-related protein